MKNGRDAPTHLSVGDSEEARNREALEAIRKVAGTLHESLEFRVVAERAVEAILDYAPFAAASIFALRENAGELELVAHRGFSDELARAGRRIPIEGSLIGVALRENRVIMSDELTDETRGIERLREALARDGFSRALIVPLLHDRNRLGALNIVVRGEHELTPRERETLLFIGQTIALALANARYVEELRRSDLRYSMATAAGGVGVWDWNLESGSFYLDPNVKRILGYTPDEIPNDIDAWSRHIHPEDRERVSRILAEYLEGGKAEFLCEHRMLHKDGSVRWILARGNGARGSDGRIARMVGTDVDITARKKLEEEHRALRDQLIHAEKLKSLGVLAGGVAHDFNNLLTTILGNAGLALGRLPKDSTTRRPLEQIELAATHAAELTRQLLAYSGKGAFVVEPTDLSKLVGEMSDLLGISVTKKARLEYELSDDLPPVEADSGQIRQVVMNLITNASDALGEAAGTIHVSTGLIEIGDDDPSSLSTSMKLAPGRHVFVEVADDGCGMDESVQSRIFDPFYTTKFTGRGLGLAAVQGIMRGHHGAVRVESLPDQGTTVTVLFPASSRQAPAPDALPKGGQVDLGGGTVLVVDDDPRVLSLASTILDEVGFTVLTAVNGREAVERFREKQDEIVLVLLDLTMPEMSGAEALREIRSIRADARVILSSGYPESDAIRDCPGSRPVRFLQKPYRPKTLIEEVRRALSR